MFLTSAMISILIVLLILFLVFKIVHVLLKAVFIVGFLILIIFGLVGLLAYNNGMSLQNSFINGTNSFLLINNSRVLTGFTLQGSKPSLISENRLSSLSSILSKEPNKIPKVLNSSYVFIFKVSAFNSSINIQEFTLPYSEVKAVLLSNSPVDELSSYISEKNSIPKKQANSELRAYFNSSSLKSFIFSEEVKSSTKNPMFLFNAYKKKELFIYPTTMLFKVVNFIPANMLKKISSKVVEEVKR